jgi:hypothetical protein
LIDFLRRSPGPGPQGLGAARRRERRDEEKALEKQRKQAADTERRVAEEVRRRPTNGHPDDFTLFVANHTLNPPTHPGPLATPPSSADWHRLPRDPAVPK